MGRLDGGLRSTLGMAAFAACLLSVAAGTAEAQTAGAGLVPVKVMSSQANLTVAVPYTVVTDCFDRAHGLDVEMLSVGASSSLMVDAVVSGSTMFATPGTATALQAIRAGADIRIVAAVANNQMVAVIRDETLKRLGVAPSAPIAERMRALKRLTIGTNPNGSTMNQLLRAYLKQYGLDPDADVKIVGVADPGALISSLGQGRFDVIVAGSGQVEQSISLGAGTLWFSAARGDIPGSEKSMICVVIARGDMVDKNPAAVNAYVAALQDALDAMRRDHAATGRVLRARYFQKLDPAVWDLVWSTETDGYPASTTFTSGAYEFWTGIDGKGPASYRDVDFDHIVYVPPKSP